MEGYPTNMEKTILRQRCYEPWRDNADVKTLLHKFVVAEFLFPYDKERIEVILTPTERNDYFFSQHVMKSSRVALNKLISILKEDPRHAVFGTEFEDILNGKYNEYETSSVGVDASSAIPAGNPFQNSHIEYYGTKQMLSAKGKGIVFIIANFTTGPDELRGYTGDVVSITEFFEKSLSCVVIKELRGQPLENLDKVKFLNALEDMRNQVELNGEYDRFYLFVLSHGTAEGVYSYDGQIIPHADITQPFLHDQMGTMKGLPKLFFIQACHGHYMAQAANPGSGPAQRGTWTNPQELIATEADIMICYAATASKLSFVETRGSWFISEVIKAFKAHCNSTEDVGVIMREVKHAISRRTGKCQFDESSGTYEIEGQNDEQGNLKIKETGDVVATGTVSLKSGKRIITVDSRQMSTVVDNLTKKFLLTIPTN